ncbi:MAG: uroporphyrinogen decarboxylase family protein [Clostridia bacterium]
MAMNSRELVHSSIEFRGVDRLPHSFGPGFDTDIEWVSMEPWLDARPRNTYDEWGAYWENIGNCKTGEVKIFPIAEWSDMEKFQVPDIDLPARWENLRDIRQKYPDKFLLGMGVSIYERIHFLRGLENTWMDIIQNPEELSKVIRILVDINLRAIEHYASEDVDGMIILDDWGLQESMMIAPKHWRKYWKPAYAEIFAALHAKGMKAFLHSCGNILAIMDDLIEIGLDVIQMDQQENMTLEVLGERFAGRINFYSPVDVQKTLARGIPDEIVAYAHKMQDQLWTEKGGLIATWYADPVGAGHSKLAVDTMCQAFMEISKQISKKIS